MAELLPETKIERLLQRMRPLADWYTANKPEVQTIHLSPDDLKLLSDNAEAAMAQGIFAEGGGLKWKRFYLRST